VSVLPRLGDNGAIPATTRLRLIGAAAATLCVAASVAACGGGNTVSLDDLDPSGGYWTIRATCIGGRLQVTFRPHEQLSVSDLGRVSSEEIAVECGEPKRVPVSDQELRRRTATGSGADLSAPTFEATRLSCVADGRLLVEAHPVWAQSAIVGGGFRVERDGQAIVTGAIMSDGYGSQLRWWRALCRPA